MYIYIFKSNTLIHIYVSLEDNNKYYFPHHWLFFFFARVNISLFFSRFLYLSLFPYIFMLVLLSACQPVYSSACLSTYLSIYLSVCLSVCLSLCPYLPLSVCLSLCPCLLLSVCQVCGKNICGIIEQKCGRVAGCWQRCEVMWEKGVAGSRDKV